MEEIVKNEYIIVNVLKYCIYPKYKSQKIISELFSMYNEYLVWVKNWSERFYQLREDKRYKEYFDLWKDTRNNTYVNDILNIAKEYGITKKIFVADLIADKGEDFAYQFRKEYNRAYSLFEEAIVSDFGLGFFNSKLFGKGDFVHVPVFTQENNHCISLKEGTLEAIGKMLYLSEPAINNLSLIKDKGYIREIKITKHGKIVITMYLHKDFEYNGIFSLYRKERLQKTYFDKQVNSFKEKMEEE